MSQHLLSFPPMPRGEPAESPRPLHYLAFLIPGNPGLIDYYDPFLSSLRRRLDASGVRHVNYHVAGHSLAGFHDDDHEPFTAANPPFDLAHQVRSMYSHISAMRIASGPSQGEQYDAVILMGHSVGAYLALEVFRHHAEQDRPSAPRLLAGVLLFPTLTHLRQSPSGQRLSFLLSLPFVGVHAHRLAATLLLPLPTWARRWILQHLLGMSPHAVTATLSFLASRDGIWQALYLSRDELERITEDNWSEELWAAAATSPAPSGACPKFFMLYAESDHWVANKHRDDFIGRRAEGPDRGAHRGGARIIVDNEGLTHAFCIDHSETVAERVKLWLDELASCSLDEVRR